MDRLKRFVFTFLGFAILLAIPAAIYLVGKNFFSFLAEIDKTGAASIVAASGTAFAAVFTVVIGQSINKKREIADAHREYKIKLYSRFIDFTINWVFKQAKKKDPVDSDADQKELEDFFIEFSKELTLWASPGVIKAWSRFRNEAGKATGADTLGNVDEIYKEMRKDLGNSNFGLDRNSLISLFIRQDNVQP